MTVDKNGTKSWHFNGQLHREDGPAVEYPTGTKFWYRHGKWHREDGPAMEYANGTKWWYLHDQSHRTDGPAVEYADGRKAWYLYGEELTEAEFKEQAAFHADLAIFHTGLDKPLSVRPGKLKLSRQK